MATVGGGLEANSVKSERKWYADWRVWFCMVLLALGGLLGSILGLPFRLLDRLLNLFF
jgi:hypothetical protein